MIVHPTFLSSHIFPWMVSFYFSIGICYWGEDDNDWWLMLVDVSLNGQHLQVKAELVQFSPLEGKVGEFIISAGKLECKVRKIL